MTRRRAVASRTRGFVQEVVIEKLPRDFVHDPDSETIAAALNNAGVTYCMHFRDPCYTFCGVRNVDGRWEPISQARRMEWLEAVCK